MKPNASTPRDGDRPLVVLFGEDDEDTCELYDIYFARHGLFPHVAHDGPDCIVKARRTHPDVIVLDITLPGLDGFEVCRALKADGTTAAIPVIAATGYWRSDTPDRARDAGFASFLLKPYAPEILLDEIRRVAAFTSRRFALACPLRTPNLQLAGRTRSHRR